MFFGLGADDDGGGYEVRAIFDNVTNLVPGEDVRVAGGKVGVVDSLDVADRNKAAVVAEDHRQPLHARSARTPSAPSARSR